MKLKKIITYKTFLIPGLAICLLTIFSIIICDAIVKKSSKEFIYSSIESIPKHKVGLVLGTSKFLKSGYINAYYKNRIQAVVELYNANKIAYVLVSGDNAHQNYNEPKMFKDDLIKEGIPKDKIILDYAGFRTLDSVVRAKEIFEQNEFILISQRFHIERAIYIAKHFNIDAIGYEAKSVSKNYGFRTKLREKLARVKVMLDFIFNTQPKFLGDKVKIG